MSQAASNVVPRLTQPTESCTHGQRTREGPWVRVEDEPHGFHWELRAFCTRCGFWVINRTDVVSFQGWHVQCGPPGR